MVPHARKVPIGAAKYLGKTTARYRWFAIFYIVIAFFLIPAAIFGLSLAGWRVLAGVGVPVLFLILGIIVLNILQHLKPQWLPNKLCSWEFLPLWMRSLEPLDHTLSKLLGRMLCCRTATYEDMDSCDSTDVNGGMAFGRKGKVHSKIWIETAL